MSSQHCLELTYMFMSVEALRCWIAIKALQTEINCIMMSIRSYVAVMRKMAFLNANIATQAAMQCLVQPSKLLVDSVMFKASRSP